MRRLRVLALLAALALPSPAAALAPPPPPRPAPRALPERDDLHSTLLQDGFVRIRGLLPPEEALAWGARVAAASAAQTASCPYASTAGAPGCAGFRGDSFTRGRALEAADAALLQLSHSPHLARAAAQVLNVSRVRLDQATAVIKSPGAAPSAWHQDAAACPLHTDKLATLWLALAPVPPEAGPLVFAAGSHLPGVPLPSLRDLAPRQRLGAMAKWTTAQVRNLTGLRVSKPLALAPGDATLHLGWTLHAAPRNAHATAQRIALAITYFADGARVHPELLEMEEAGAGGGGDGSEGKGVAFVGEDGRQLRVNLLQDDAETWGPWLHKKPSMLVPGAPVRDPVLTPLLYDELYDSTPHIPL